MSGSRGARQGSRITHRLASAQGSRIARRLASAQGSRIARRLASAQGSRITRRLASASSLAPATSHRRLASPHSRRRQPTPRRRRLVMVSKVTCRQASSGSGTTVTGRGTSAAAGLSTVKVGGVRLFLGVPPQTLRGPPLGRSTRSPNLCARLLPEMVKPSSIWLSTHSISTWRRQPRSGSVSVKGRRRLLATARVTTWRTMGVLGRRSGASSTRTATRRVGFQHSSAVQYSIYSTTVGSLLEQCWNNTYSTHHCIRTVQYTYVQYVFTTILSSLDTIKHSTVLYSTVRTYAQYSTVGIRNMFSQYM